MEISSESAKKLLTALETFPKDSEESKIAFNIIYHLNKILNQEDTSIVVHHSANNEYALTPLNIINTILNYYCPNHRLHVILEDSLKLEIIKLDEDNIIRDDGKSFKLKILND